VLGSEALQGKDVAERSERPTAWEQLGCSAVDSGQCSYAQACCSQSESSACSYWSNLDKVRWIVFGTRLGISEQEVVGGGNEHKEDWRHCLEKTEAHHA